MRVDLVSLQRLADDDLVALVKSVAARQRGATAELVAHLSELARRDVFLRQGYGSLFVYCRDALGLSEHDAYNAIEVGRAARRYPVVLEMLAEGSIHLTAVRILAPHLTAENHLRVLESARGKRKLQVEEIAARLAPMPDAPACVRRLPAPSPAAETAFGADSPDVDRAPKPWTPPAAVKTYAAPVAPLAPYRYKLQVTIDGGVLEKLQLARDMLRHAMPSGDDAAILDRALTALLAELTRKKFGAVDNPRPSPGAAPGSRHVPAEVKRAVWLRDLGRCAFVGDGGRRCNERAFVEFHHLRPYALGGPANVENIQLRCRRHNCYEARVCFGDGRTASSSP